jgi:hypothetical protein
MRNKVSMREALAQMRQGSSGSHHVNPYQIPEVDALIFLTSPEFMHESPLPFQRVAIKTLYNLWDKYPPDAEEHEFLETEAREWDINTDLTDKSPVTHLVLVLGRRSGKTTLASFVATYSLYQLICLGNPQAHYDLRNRQPIHIMHLACKEGQAQEVYNLTRDKITSMEFFAPFIDFDKNTSTTLRLFTPFDLAMSKTNERTVGTPLPGTIYIESVPTVGASNRGKSIYTLIISEFAHFQRSGVDLNQQTDYEIYRALSPSAKDFKNDGKILLESSPREKAGEFYNQYCLAGGPEQEHGVAIRAQAGYRVIQAATWQANPRIRRDELAAEFAADPDGARMEYGAHFANPSSSFISEDVIEQMFVRDGSCVPGCDDANRYIISVDPGGASVSADADAYAIAWGHYDRRANLYCIDGLHAFRTEKRMSPEGKWERVPVDACAATRFVLSLGAKLGGPRAVVEIVYDQWNSQLPISVLQKSGYDAHETTFTLDYKQMMVGTFLEVLNRGEVKIVVEPREISEELRRQLRFLQREFRGGSISYHAPSTGTVRHDDLAMAVMNLIYRLARVQHPTRDILTEKREFGRPPIVRHTGCKPQLIRISHWSATGNRPRFPDKLKGRI